MADPVALVPFSREQLIAHAALTPEDLEQVEQCRRDYNRLGFAYQIAFVRLTNRFPAQHPFEVVDELLAFTGAQLGIDPDQIDWYSQRQQTISEHQVRIRDYLRLRPFGEAEWGLLERFLFEECCRLEQTAALRSQAEQFLRESHILQPAPSTLDRLIGEQRRKAREHIFERIAGSLPADVVGRLDDLLQAGEGKRSGLHVLKEPPGVPCPAAAVRLANKLEAIRGLGVPEVDLSWLNNNYQRSLAKYARRCSAYKLREVEPSHRYSALICFLWQTYRDSIDHLVDMQDKLVLKVCNRAQNQCDDALRQRHRSIRRSVSMFRSLASVVLDEGVVDGRVREEVFQRIPRDDLALQVQEADGWLSGADSHMFPGVVRRFDYVRKFFPVILRHLEFEAQGRGESAVIQAARALTAMNEAGRRTLPEDAPMEFLPEVLRPFVADNDAVNKQAWECALLLSLRDEIKSGNLAVAHSKRFGQFDDFFVSDQTWQARREAFFRRAGLPHQPEEAGAFLTELLDHAYDAFLGCQSSNAYAAVTEEGWKLSSDPAEKLDKDAGARLDALRAWLAKHMRVIRLPELLIEVDNELDITQHFLSPAFPGGRTAEGVCATIATIMAHGCNIGPYTMARLTENVPYKQIKRITDWQLTEENQRAALAELVHAISRLGTTSVWGEGRTSSSDGQRFLFPRRVLQRTFSHKMSDFALEFYSFVADNYAPFYSTPIECTDRDAAYVLDGLLYNESDLALEEHYTDTHGYTEINFAAFAMLGRRFCPRIKGLQDQRIYRITRDRDYGTLAPLVNPGDRVIHLDWIRDQWDRMGQFYASLESGHTTASVALKRLASYSKKNHFYRANRELGRVFKTAFILDYMSQPPLRRRVRRGLLKGEQLHTLARDVCFGKRGRISARDLQEQMNTCSCLTLILACIIYWQAREIERVVSECCPEAEKIDVSLLEHISPIEWDNVLLYGQYVIDRSLIRIA
jgi:TnpA family transposase